MPGFKSYENMCMCLILRNPLLARLLRTCRWIPLVSTVTVVCLAYQLPLGTPLSSADTAGPACGMGCQTSVSQYSADVLPSIGSETGHGIGNTLSAIVLDANPLWSTWGGASGRTSVPALIQESRACLTEKPKQPPLWASSLHTRPVACRRRLSSSK